MKNSGTKYFSVYFDWIIWDAGRLADRRWSTQGAKISTNATEIFCADKAKRLPWLHEEGTTHFRKLP